MRVLRTAVTSVFALLLTLPTAHAKDFTEQEVPSVLKPWIGWVLSDYEKNPCPFLYNDINNRTCIWPGELSLDLAATSGKFRFSVTAYQKDSRIFLPGNSTHWPQNVTVNGANGVVTEENGLPALLLNAGNYTIQGSFQWDDTPEMLTIPAGTALLSVTVNGSALTQPEIDGNNQLWVSRKIEKAQTQEDKLELKLFRKLSDGIPFTVSTELQLNISGKPREKVIGNVLLDGTVPTQVSSVLPARLEPDGTLRMQLKPGSWNVRIDARYKEPVNAINLAKAESSLTTEEIWVYEARPDFRLTQIEPSDHVRSIDPSQTPLPAEWQSLPAYHLTPGATFSIKESRRGETNPAPDNFRLRRNLWQDFDGNGYTLRDQISATIHQDGRLEAAPNVTLGRVAINGQDQFINRLDASAASGVEVRRGQLSLESDSRIEKATYSLPATGWLRDVAAVETVLHLAPGWRLLGVTGADTVSNSWVKSWSFASIFLVLLATLIVYRMKGMKAAGLVAVGLALIHPDLWEFVWYCLSIVILVALLGKLPEGKLRRFISGLRVMLIVLLVLTVLPFIVTQVRNAIYPQLKGFSSTYNDGYGYGSYADDAQTDKLRHEEERRRYSGQPSRGLAMGGNIEGSVGNILMGQMDAPMVAMAPPPPPASPAPEMVMKMEAYNANEAVNAAPEMTSKASISSSVNTNQFLYDPSMKVQTGLGVATWNIGGNDIRINISGPITDKDTLKLWMLSPWQNLLFVIFQVAFILVIVALMCGFPAAPSGWKEQLKKAGAIFAASAATLLLVGLLPGTEAYAQEVAISPPAARSVVYNQDNANTFPPELLLNELRDKLIKTLDKQPTCLPGCASVSKTRLVISQGRLTVLQEIHAAEATAVPLPGGVANWRPDTLTVDSAKATALRVDGNGHMLVQLEKGVHQIVMSGGLPQVRDTVNLSLPLASRYTEASVEGWEVQGIRENGASDMNLQLLRTEKAPTDATQEAVLERSKLPAFLQVERVLTLGISWEVQTTVRRLTPSGDTVVAEIPLLGGETLTTAEIPVKEGKAFINLGPNDYEKSWSSVLKPVDELTFTAPKDTPWVEIWRFNVSNLWHARFEGIPSVRSDSAYGQLQSYHPWPGETVTLTAIRPEGITGQTLTIDRTLVKVKPASRAITGSVQLSLRSSQGGQHSISLPKGAKLENVSIDGAPILLQQKGDSVTLPVRPGTQQIDLNWQLTQENGVKFSVPAITLGLPSVNAETLVEFPSDRWVLFTYGPRIGPAVLFWGWLPVVVLLAILFARTGLTPLKPWQWILLLVGLSQLDLSGIIVVSLWLLALGWRERSPDRPKSALIFNARQVLLVILTFAGLSALISGVFNGLMSQPDMQITGNGSYSGYFKWYQDIAGEVLPQPTVISLPIVAYKALMMLWGFWLALALTRWLAWGWKCYSTGGYWRKSEPKPEAPVETIVP